IMNQSSWKKNIIVLGVATTILYSPAFAANHAADNNDGPSVELNLDVLESLKSSVVGGFNKVKDGVSTAIEAIPAPEPVQKETPSRTVLPTSKSTEKTTSKPAASNVSDEQLPSQLP